MNIDIDYVLSKEKEQINDNIVQNRRPKEKEEPPKYVNLHDLDRAVTPTWMPFEQYINDQYAKT